MSQNVTISVPDELYEKMQQWKSSFNYSKLFQETVSMEIQKQEDFKVRLKGDANMDEIIERLKKEKAESGKEYFEDGKNEGLEWAKASHYDEIQIGLRFTKYWTEGSEAGLSYPWEWETGVNSWEESWEDYWKNILEEDPAREDHGESFIDGWVEGVNEFWEEVERKI